jgi:2-polyprenyl-6-hydroxyphenyl methylase/3-demethylubiquinone-9 3-methyltransferase
LTFQQGVFDAVFCIQNGISAFGVDRRKLIAEALRVAKDDGLVFFSSYSPKIWKHRLAWFREQSRAGLIGEIDEFRTGRGTIICKDGFRATSVSRAEFRQLFLRTETRPRIREIDESSIFCVARKLAPVVHALR